jgi:hypothetical protein
VREYFPQLSGEGVLFRLFEMRCSWWARLIQGIHGNTEISLPSAMSEYFAHREEFRGGERAKVARAKEAIYNVSHIPCK